MFLRNNARMLFLLVKEILCHKINKFVYGNSSMRITCKCLVTKCSNCHQNGNLFLLTRKMSKAVHLGKFLMNSTTTLTELVAASIEKVSASLDSAEPPPARSDRDLMMTNGFLCWRQISATEALSISTGVGPNLS